MTWLPKFTNHSNPQSLYIFFNVCGGEIYKVYVHIHSFHDEKKTLFDQVPPRTSVIHAWVILIETQGSSADLERISQRITPPVGDTELIGRCICDVCLYVSNGISEVMKYESTAIE